MKSHILSLLLLFVCVPALCKEATFYNVSVKHDVTENHKAGMKILATFNISDCQGETCKVMAIFYNSINGAKIKKNSAGYRTTSSDMAVWSKFTPPYQSAKYTDLELFIPYSAFELSNNPYELEFELYVCDSGNHTLRQSERYKFLLLKNDMNCTYCNGTGKCSSCRGQGGYSITYSSWNTCFSCKGRKTCSYCGGDGAINLTKSQPPVSSTGNSSAPGYAPTNSSTPPSYNTTRTQCRLCNGTGKIKMPIAATNSNYIEVCGECGETMKYSKHIHQICTNCSGTGYK